MARVVKIIKNANVGFGPVPAAGTPIDPATLDDYSCQVTEARVTATANTTDVAATFCEPKSKINAPSSFELTLAGLQDWGVADGLSEFLFAHDAENMAFGVFLDGVLDPSASGVCSIAAGDFGGVAGEPLTLSLTLPIQGYPEITDSAGVSIRGASTMAADSGNAPAPAPASPEPEPAPV